MEIESVLRHIYDGGAFSRSPSGADERTLRRWWNEFSGKLKEWAGILESWVFKLYRRPPNLLKLLPHPLKRLEEALNRLSALPSTWSVLTKAL
jgi:hypothetical protein